MDIQKEFPDPVKKDLPGVDSEGAQMDRVSEQEADFVCRVNPIGLTAAQDQEMLDYILDLGQQEVLAKDMTVFEILGRPQHFPSVGQMGEQRMEEMLQDLLRYMAERGMEVTVFSPNVTRRELYRFITEELFPRRMLHMPVPGMVTCFIYDEFHPDYAYENERAAVGECLGEIFCIGEMRWTFHYAQLVSLNQYRSLSIDAFRRRVNTFKEMYEEIEPLTMEVTDSRIAGEVGIVEGRYMIRFTTATEQHVLEGRWTIRFHFREDLDMWMIDDIQVEGIGF